MNTVNDYRERVSLLRRAYEAFNRRDIDAVLAGLDPEVEWPNLLDQTIAHGHGEVRAYWERQFQIFDPQVEPTDFIADGNDRIVVSVHSLVRDREGAICRDSYVAHAYTFRNGPVTSLVTPLVTSMKVYPSVEEAMRAV